jgi:hypothetical protein
MAVPDREPRRIAGLHPRRRILRNSIIIDDGSVTIFPAENANINVGDRGITTTTPSRQWTAVCVV